jgi:hypothetical protein
MRRPTKIVPCPALTSPRSDAARHWGATKPFSQADEKVLQQRRSIFYYWFKWWGMTMLSEKFILVLEAILKSSGRVYPDGAPRIVSTSPHVPVKLPASK